LSKFWNPNQDHILTNHIDKPTSAVTWCKKFSSIAGSHAVASILARLDRHDTLASEPIHGIEGVKSHENAKVLYKTIDAHFMAMHGWIDMTIMGLCGIMLLQGKFFCMMPISYLFYQQWLHRWPKNSHFVIQAELLPHSEQVVFTKIGMFGRSIKQIVEINHLERVEADTMPHPHIFLSNQMDPEMVFRCMDSNSFFVFDKNGVWNKETLEHPLLN
jgi:hypothetical protein